MLKIDRKLSVTLGGFCCCCLNKYCNNKMNGKVVSKTPGFCCEVKTVILKQIILWGAGRACWFYQKVPSWTSLTVMLIVGVHLFFVCQISIIAPVLTLQQPPSLGHSLLEGLVSCSMQEQLSQSHSGQCIAQTGSPTSLLFICFSPLQLRGDQLCVANEAHQHCQ